jgi:hypothetical protein
MKTSGKESEGRGRSWLMGIGLVVLAAILISVGVGLRGEEQSAPDKKDTALEVSDRLPAAVGAGKVPEGVELFDHEGQNHVADGTKVPYKTDPPTSGPHYNRWMPPSVYGVGEAAPELLVHNLEHGNVVIYFNPSVLGKNEVDELTEISKKYIGQWDGVVLVVREDKEAPVILTAWRSALRLKRYNKEKVMEFLDAFRGRGPENPVR